MRSNLYNPILVTGADRSGSSLIARILDMCGAHTGVTNNMFENKELQHLSKAHIIDNSKVVPYPKFNSISLEWQKEVLTNLNGVDQQWMFKSPLITQMWETWHYAFPNAKWIIVRRKTPDIVNSCIRTGYMKMFKSKEHQALINVESEAEAWQWWIHKYEKSWVEMIMEGVNCKMIWPERMAEGDYSQIYEMIEWLGLEKAKNIPQIMDPLLNKGGK